MNSYTPEAAGFIQPPEFCIKGALKNFAKFTGKDLCQRLCDEAFHDNT